MIAPAFAKFRRCVSLAGGWSLLTALLLPGGAVPAADFAYRGACDASAAVA